MDWSRFIQMPLEIGSSPVQAPLVFCSDEFSSCNWRVSSFSLVLPIGPNFENVHRVANNLEPEVKLLSDVLRRCMPCHEPL